MALFERDDRELMQQIVLLVDKDRPALESEGVAAAALASVNAFLAQPDLPEWRQWAAGHFGKSVRRADARTFPKIVAEFADSLGGFEGEARLDEHDDASVGGVAIAFVPAAKEELPKKVAKLQVSGTALPRTPEERREWLAAREPAETAEPRSAEGSLRPGSAAHPAPEASTPDNAPPAGSSADAVGASAWAPVGSMDTTDSDDETVSHDRTASRDGTCGGDTTAVVVLVLNDGLGMSTGKASAQAAHALFAWLLEAIRHDHPRVDAWLAAGQPLDVRWADAEDFEALKRQATGPLIRDAGRTEIEPGSVTAFVV
ncbi:aminoacyl-tRNA hydrolase [Zhihengliuella alba]|uniref:aminoacyl-tRNA hydrolase n=1 Tax=Zhihengliuella alba TaxID=547018 RepID=UPI0031E7FC80